MRILLLLCISLDVRAQCIPVDCNDNLVCTNDSCINSVCVYTPIGCTDILPCTTDECIELPGSPFGYNCIYTPILFCNNYPCDTLHCKVRIALQDSCNYCFWHSDVSGTNPDSIVWHFTNWNVNPVEQIRINIFDSIVCPDFPMSGTWSVNIRVYFKSRNSYMVKVDSREFEISLCENDNNPCTNDTCINGICTAIPIPDCGVQNCLTPSDCNDQNLCTWDECWQGQCRHQKACINCNAGEKVEYRRLCCCR